MVEAFTVPPGGILGNGISLSAWYTILLSLFVELPISTGSIILHRLHGIAWYLDHMETLTLTYGSNYFLREP